MNDSGRIWTDLASILEVQIHQKSIDEMNVFQHRFWKAFVDRIEIDFDCVFEAFFDQNRDQI